MLLKCGSRNLDLSSPKIMGILNVTPDSFYDGGGCVNGGVVDISKALKKAEKMLADGAAIIDVGGESTRPGADLVGLQEELDRVVPIVEAISAQLDVIVSVDTSQPSVMSEAIDAGAGLVNDVRALRQDGALQAVSGRDVAICLMHMKGQPNTMQHDPCYDDVVAEVMVFLSERTACCVQAGIEAQQVILDPGIGFGKADSHNLALLNRLDGFASSAQPLLVGLSRKSMIGRLLGRKLEGRLVGSLGFGLVALQRGAHILRVHDVAETRDIMRVFALTEHGTSASL